MTRKLPKTIDVGPFKIEIQVLPSAIAYEGNEEGAPPMETTITLNFEEIELITRDKIIEGC